MPPPVEELRPDLRAVVQRCRPVLAKEPPDVKVIAGLVRQDATTSCASMTRVLRAIVYTGEGSKGGGSLTAG